MQGPGMASWQRANKPSGKDLKARVGLAVPEAGTTNTLRTTCMEGKVPQS